MIRKFDKETTKHTVMMFRKTDALHLKSFEGKVRDMGIHRSQHRMLMYIDEYKGISQTDLAERLDISSAAVAVSIKKLESDGYIQRRSSDRDNRFNEIELTEKGKEMVRVSRVIFSDIESAMLEGIDEDMLDNFLKCLEIMQTNLLKLCDGQEGEDR